MREIREVPGRSLRLNGQQVEEARLMPPSSRVMEAISFIASILPEETNWLVIKKRLLLELPTWERQLFSTRDPKTKRHGLYNAFERQVRKRWFEMTGNVLVMPENKMLEGIPREAYLSLD